MIVYIWQGEETKSIAIARTDRITLIILGIKRPGLIAVYSVDETTPNIQPEFEGLYHDIQRFDKNWEDLVDDGEASMLEPDDIKY